MTSNHALFRKLGKASFQIVKTLCVQRFVPLSRPSYRLKSNFNSSLSVVGYFNKMARSSSDSSDDERKTVRIGPAPPIPKKTYATKSSTMQKRKKQCCLLIRKKWFIAAMSAFILLLILAIVLGVTLGGKNKSVVYSNPVNLTWWQNSTIYRCYVTSYVDSDGDGIGDFKGSFRYEKLNSLLIVKCLSIH